MRRPSDGGLQAKMTRLVLVCLIVMASATATPTQAAAAPSFVTGVGDPLCPHGGNYVSTACLLYNTAYIVESNIPKKATSARVVYENHRVVL